MRKHLACLAVIAAALPAGLSGPSTAAASTRQQLAPGSSYLIPQIDRWRNETWHWQRLMGKPRTRSSFSARRALNPAYRELLRVWKQRAARARANAATPPRLRSWLCIFRYERHSRQGWRTNTGNGFYGGLQVNIAFQRNHGGWLLRRKGTANRWTPFEQIWVAERGRRAQGWYAWPNTARRCGLI